MRGRATARWALLAALCVLALLLGRHRHQTQIQVFWEDAAAAAAPFPTRYSRSFQSVYPFPAVLVSQQRAPCLPPGSATVRSGGRLGNLILEYASLWTAARLYNLSAFVPSEMLDNLEKVFEPLDLPTTEEFLNHWTCPEELLYEAEDSLREVDRETTRLSDVVSDSKLHQRLIVFDMYTILVETIVPMVRALRRQLRYRPELQTHAQESLRTIRQAVLSEDPSVKEVVFAGVHVRRTDYPLQLQHLYNSRHPADEGYYGRAALWLRDKVVRPGGQLVLVVASDDPDWVRSVLVPHLHWLGFQHVYVTGGGEPLPPEYDLALLSACNHSVLAYGTYGIWSALAAGGRAVVYHLDIAGAASPAMTFAQHMPGWVAVK